MYLVSFSYVIAWSWPVDSWATFLIILYLEKHCKLPNVCGIDDIIFLHYFFW